MNKIENLDRIYTVEVIGSIPAAPILGFFRIKGLSLFSSPATESRSRRRSVTVGIFVVFSAPKGVTPMEPQRPKIPAEAIELYNKYIHGEISRRDFLEGAKRFAIAGLAATTIIDGLMPN